MTVSSARFVLPLVVYVLAHVATGVRYLALGDSFAAGAGSGGAPRASTQVKFPDYDRCCFRRGNAYPNIVNKSISASFFEFRACSGAVTTGHGNSVLTGQLRSPPPNMDFVTVTVGGNDIGAASVMVSCLVPEIVRKDCLQAAATAKKKAETELGPKIRNLESRLRSIYANTTTIAFTGYPLPYPPTRSFDGNTSCQSNEIQVALNGAVVTLNQAIKRNVQNFIPISFAGHELCRITKPWFNKAPSPAVVRQKTSKTPPCDIKRYFSRSFGGSFHPSMEGQQEYARSVVKWYQQSTM